LHASECAFWESLPLQMASLMQTVPDMDGTEIIIESTANGFNEFHSLWRKAEAGESEILPVFLPWSLDDGYRREIDTNSLRLRTRDDVSRENLNHHPSDKNSPPAAPR
jgi:hypothetical protein